jgi:tRNA-specific adenosine deaminase 2
MTTTWTEREKGHMRQALVLAERALDTLEVAVGCVFVSLETGEVVTSGHNDTNARFDATRHAEIVAFEAVADKLIAASRARAAALGREHEAPRAHEPRSRFLCAAGRDLPLRGIELYVTVEPCIMCAAFLSEMGISRVTYGCANPRFGGTGTVQAINEIESPMHHPYEARGGLLQDEAIELLQRFYAQNNPRTHGGGAEGEDGKELD